MHIHHRESCTKALCAPLLTVSGSNTEVVPGRRLSPWPPAGPLLVLLSASEINVVLLLIIVVGMFDFFSSLKNSFACLILKTWLPAWVTCPSSTPYQIAVWVCARKDCWYLWTGSSCRGSVTELPQAKHIILAFLLIQRVFYCETFYQYRTAPNQKPAFLTDMDTPAKVSSNGLWLFQHL